MKIITKADIILYLKQVISTLKSRYDKILVNAGAITELKKIREQMGEAEQQLQIEENEFTIRLQF